MNYKLYVLYETNELRKRLKNYKRSDHIYSLDDEFIDKFKLTHNINDYTIVIKNQTRFHEECLYKRLQPDDIITVINPIAVDNIIIKKSNIGIIKEARHSYLYQNIQENKNYLIAEFYVDGKFYESQVNYNNIIWLSKCCMMPLNHVYTCYKCKKPHYKVEQLEKLYAVSVVIQNESLDINGTAISEPFMCIANNDDDCINITDFFFKEKYPLHNGYYNYNYNPMKISDYMLNSINKHIIKPKSINS